jgi:hypothetical protein
MIINWKKQHCGVHRASWGALCIAMPEVATLIRGTFPAALEDFTWDVKVHMLMPNQFPCIPNWHFDNVPRVNNAQDWDQVRTDLPMYLWISGAPLTEFKGLGLIKAQEWKRFTQKDEHRGTMSEDFQWRGFIRATHKDILPSNPSGTDIVRRHSQVYLDSSKFAW